MRREGFCIAGFGSQIVQCARVAANEGEAVGNQFRQRVISGLIMAIGAFMVTWLGGIYFQLFMAVVALVVLKEFNAITRDQNFPKYAFVTFAFLALIIASWISGQQQTALAITLCAFVVLVIWQGWATGHIWAGFGLLYSVIPFVALVHLRGDSQAGFLATIFVFACVWGADTLAYFSGKAIGGPKLAPKISPGKTWAGFFGAMIGGIAIAWLVMMITGHVGYGPFIFIAAIVVLFSQLGDLAESMLKRQFEVKDSGELIPGHGGVLDRIDGLIFAAFFTWVFSVSLAGEIFQSLPHDPARFLIHALFGA